VASHPTVGPSRHATAEHGTTQSRPEKLKILVDPPTVGIFNFWTQKSIPCCTRHHGRRTAPMRTRDGQETGGFASDRRPETTRNSRTRDHAIPTGKAKNSGRSAHGRSFQFLDAKINPLLHTPPRPQNGANAHPRRPRDWWLRIRPSARDNTHPPNTGPRNPDRKS
jgi:hypothetical protein